MGDFKNIANGTYLNGTDPNINQLPNGFWQRLIIVINSILVYLFNGAIWIKAILFARNIGNKKEILKPITTKYQDYRTLESQNKTIRIVDNTSEISIEDSTYTNKSFTTSISEFFNICYFSQLDLNNINRYTAKDIKIINVNNTPIGGFKTFQIDLEESSHIDFNPIINNNTDAEYKWRFYLNKNNISYKIDKYNNRTFYHSGSAIPSNGDTIEILNPYVNYENIQPENKPLKLGIAGTTYVVNGVNKTIREYIPGGYLALETKLVIFVNLLFTDDTSCLTYLVYEDFKNPEITVKNLVELTSPTLSTTPLITQTTANLTIPNSKAIIIKDFEHVGKLGEGSNRYIGVGYCTLTTNTNIIPIYFDFILDLYNQNTLSFSILNQPMYLNFDPINYPVGTTTNNKIQALGITKYKGKWRMFFWDYSDHLAGNGYTAIQNSQIFEIIFKLPLNYIVSGISTLNDYTKTIINVPSQSTGILKGIGNSLSYVNLDDKLYILQGFDNRESSDNYLTKNRILYNIGELNSDNITWNYGISGPYIFNPINYLEGSGEQGFLWQNNNMGETMFMFKYKNTWFLLTSFGSSSNTNKIVLLKLRNYFYNKYLKDYTKSYFNLTSDSIIQENQTIITADCTVSGTKTIYLKDAELWINKEIFIKKYGTVGTLIVQPSSGDSINESTLPLTINTNTAICFKSVLKNTIKIF